MADFKKYDREKIKEKIKSKRMFITGSSRDEKSDTVLTSSYNEMSKSFANNSYLASDGTNTSPVGGLIYMMNEMQEDIGDLHSEISQSVYVAQISELSTISTGSIGVLSSSLIPNLDNTYDLGSSGKEWKDLYIDGTANIDSLAMGVTVNTIKDEDNMSSNSNTSLATQQSIKAYVDANGGGTIDTTLKNGSTNAVQNNAVFDGLATKLNLTGGAMTGLIRPIVTAVTGAPKNNQLDASKTNVYEFNSSKAITIDSIIPAFTGQEITLMNIGTGAITITRSSKGQARTIFGKANLTINQNEAYKLICNRNSLWYVIS